MELPIPELAIAIVSSGVVIHIIDRIIYRKKPGLDIATQAQALADMALKNAREEMQQAWNAAERAQSHADNAGKRIEHAEQLISELKIQIIELTTRMQMHEETEERMRRQLTRYESIVTAKDAIIVKYQQSLSECSNQ